MCFSCEWCEACREAGAIVRDKTHPRFMEMYERWRAQLTSDTPCKQFPNFVRAVLVSEKRVSELENGSVKLPKDKSAI